MSLIRCQDCRNMVSSSASKCHHCGKVRTTASHLVWAILLALILFLVGGQLLREFLP